MASSSSSSSEDPLLLLRGTLVSGQEIQLLDAAGEQVFELQSATQLAFTSPSTGTKRTFPKDTPTRFVQTGHSLDDPSSPLYQLQQLLFAFLTRDATIPDYLRQAGEAEVPFLPPVDRMIVSEWLSGKTPVDGLPRRIKALEGGASKRPAEDEAAPAAGGAGAAGGGAGRSGQAPPAKKQRFVPNREDQDKVQRLLAIVDGPQYGYLTAPGEDKKERAGAVYHNRETVLRGERINNFESVRALIGPRLKILRDDQTKAGSQAAPPPPAAGTKPQKKKQMNPIIIISPSSTALITMHNVKLFLENAKFVPSEQARAEAAAAEKDGGATEDMVQINHARVTSSSSTAETRAARYFIVDSIEALSKFGAAGKLDEAWDRVVCVLTTGQEWQFKPYKWKEPKDLFRHVKGVYPQWATDPLNEKVKSWNVSELRIDARARHKDKATVAEFWRGLEVWITQNKPWLSY